jgi:hypothetical protein
MEVFEVIPNARRIIKSLRDMGYDFSAAVADIIDNSIEAGASRVDIAAGFYGNDSFVLISDNGKGMDNEELKEAMRYGSERDYNEEDLGKFGLGLKTASMSQCQRLSVASKPKDSKNIAVFCWDLAHIEKANKWEILQITEKDAFDFISSTLLDHQGTVVLWEKLDRIIDFKNPDGEAARKKMISMCRDLEMYLGMVFHKFLSNEVPTKPLEIYLNNNKILPWDPFAREESKTKRLAPIKIKLISQDVEGKIVLQPYILPTKEEFSSFGKFKQLSGPLNWNQQQGFYIYRAGRMIQSGGWCGLRVPDEHTKLSRIELNFSPVFDNAFKINVPKMRVQLPAQIREIIDSAISPVVQVARDYYDKGNKISSTNYPTLVTTNATITSEKDLASKKETDFPARSDRYITFTIDEIEKQAKELATGEEKNIISNIFIKLRRKLFGRA